MLRSFLARWMHGTRQPLRRPDRARARAGFRPQLDALEERNLLSGISLLADGQPSLGAAYGKLPLSFEANQGQTDAQVNYLARGQGYTIFLTPQAAVLNLRQAGSNDAEVLRMQLVGANDGSPATASDRLAGTSNYYIGSDPSQWHTNVPNFGSVEYHNVYNGVDLVYYGNQQQLEYDFVVAPGADPHAIALDFQGVESVSLNNQGDLLLHTANGDITQHAPVMYQDVNGARQLVQGAFVLQGGNKVGFEVGAYDPTKPLVIDPVVLSYSTYLGGGLNDVGNAIAIDQGGDAYVTGSTNSINFPTTPGAFQQFYQDTSNTDAFVTKFNPTGSGLIFSTYVGGASADQGNGIAVDSSGFSYVVGTTASINFPSTQGSQQPQFAGSTDAFVARFSPSGALVYNTFLGGQGADQGRAIAVDNNSQAYVTGVTFSQNFPTTTGVVQPSYPGGAANTNSVGFVASINSAGSQLLYSTYLGGTGGDQANAIAVNATLGLAYIAGTTRSTNFPPPTNAAQQTFGGGSDAFLVELNPTGSAALYGTYIGGSTTEQGNGIAIVPNVDGKNTGNDYIYVTGSTDSFNFPVTPAVVQSSLGGNVDAFVTKIAPATGGPFLYSTYLGGLASDVANAIAVDTLGNAYVVGQTNSSNFPLSSSPLQGQGGGRDAFLSELNSAGTGLNFSTYLGGTFDDNGLGVAVDAGGNAYLTGSTAGGFPITGGSFQTTYGGGFTDGFVSKLSNLPTPANHLAFGTQPTTTLFSAPITPAVTVQVLDQTNQVVTSDNSDQITIAIGSNPGGGTLGGTITMTVQSGVAKFSDLTINKPGMGYTLVASAPTISSVISNRFDIIQPTHLVFEPNGQPTDTVQGATITPPVRVDILDANNQLVTADNTDQITIGIGTNPGGGTLGGVRTVTAVNGVATFDTLSIDQPGNGYTLVATGTGLQSATSGTFNILSSNPVPTHLDFLQEPTNTPPNQAIAPPITVRILDVNNNVVTKDNSDQVTLTLGTNPSGATLGGTTTVTVVKGIATFSNVSVSKVGTGYTLKANVVGSSLTGATSTAFNVFIPAPATHLGFGQQPTSAQAGSTIKPPVTVSVLDATGSVVTTDNADIVTLTIANNPGGGTLSGTVSVKVVSGVATFSNLAIFQAGNGYTLSATSGSLTPAISQPFNIFPGPVTHLGVQAQSVTTSGSPFTITVSALDQFNGVNASYLGTVHLSSSDPDALLPLDYTFQPGDAGVHSFSVVLNSLAFQTITATDTSNPAIFGSVVIFVKNGNIFNQYVVGADAGGGPEVKVIDGATKALALDFFAYDPAFTGGVRVAMGDVSGNGTADIVTGPGPGGGPDIHVYNASGQMIRQFFAFDPGFTGGVYVAVGDVNADGFSDIVVGADAGGGPNVRVFSGFDNSLLGTFFAYNINFTGGVRVATGDVNGDNHADIICGAGPGGGPNVTVLSGTNFSVLSSFFAYDPAFTAGVYVATGVFDSNPAAPVQIVTGPGFGGGPDVRVFNGMNGALVQNFLAEQAGNFALLPDSGQGFSGVRVGTINIDGFGAQIVTSFGFGHQPNVKVFDYFSAEQVDSFFAYDPLFTGGVFVGVGSR